MKLQELATPKNTEKIAQVFESYFGNHIAVSRLSAPSTQKILGRVRGLIREHRNTLDRHSSERNPAYLKLVMLEQALAAHLLEIDAPAATASTPQPAKPIDANKLRAAQDKLAKKQILSKDEQDLINAAALSQQKTTENRLHRAFNVLKESEVEQAQVVLAAQDMVDSMQSMIEDASEMQYKELPALVDSIRDQVGLDQSTQFNSDATAALTTLVQSLQNTKQQLETALGVVTGQQQPAPALPGAEPDLGAEVPELEPELEPMPGEEVPEPKLPQGSKSALGRERR